MRIKALLLLLAFLFIMNSVGYAADNTIDQSKIISGYWALIHAHDINSDGVLTEKELCSLVNTTPAKILVITNHLNCLLGICDTANYPHGLHKRGDITEKYFADKGGVYKNLYFVREAEVFTDKDKVHLLCLDINSEMTRQDEFKKLNGKSIDEIINYLHGKNGLVVFAHPQDYGNRELPSNIDAIEFFNCESKANVEYAMAPNIESYCLAIKNYKNNNTNTPEIGLPSVIGGSDCHVTSNIFFGYTFFQAKHPTMDELYTAIKEGKTYASRRNDPLFYTKLTEINFLPQKISYVVNEKVSIQGKLQAWPNIGKLILYRDGEKFDEQDYANLTSKDYTFNFLDRPEAGRHIYFLYVAGRLLTSPIVFDVAQKPTDNQNSQLNSSSTVLITDLSGSMNNPDADGTQSKLEAVKQAALRLLGIIKNDKAAHQSNHQLGLVSFRDNGAVEQNLSGDIESGIIKINSLTADGNTNLGEGLSLGIDELSKESMVKSENKIIILLSDGLTNRGMSREELMSPDNPMLQKAREYNIHIYTVGFGKPGATVTYSNGVTTPDIDQELLEYLAGQTGGKYYYAQDSWDLAGIYTQIRHISTGNLIYSQMGEIRQDQQLALNELPIAGGCQEFLLTLNWPGSQLELQITDPKGNVVNANYQDAYFQNEKGMISMIVKNPAPGNWKVAVIGRDVPEGMCPYSVLASSRELIPVYKGGGRKQFYLGGMEIIFGALILSILAVIVLIVRQLLSRGKRK